MFIVNSESNKLRIEGPPNLPLADEILLGVPVGPIRCLEAPLSLSQNSPAGDSTRVAIFFKRIARVTFAVVRVNSVHTIMLAAAIVNGTFIYQSDWRGNCARGYVALGASGYCWFDCVVRDPHSNSTGGSIKVPSARKHHPAL